MWHLQPKNHVLAHKSRFKKIFSYSLLGHLCLLFCLLFVLAEGPVQISVNNTKGARIVCVPAFMLPALQQKQVQIKQAQGRAHKTEKVDKKLSTKKEIEPKFAPQKHKSRLTGLFQHTAKKRQFSTKDMAPQPVVEEQVEIKQEIVKQEHKQEEKPAEVSQSEELSDVIYVDKETYASLQIAQELQQAIAEQWAPPAGVPSHISCDIKVELNAQGKAQQVVMIKKSGLAAYDMAARTALLKAVYPKLVWGRTVVVHFDEEFACGT
jgi:hypothetical protein